jgi:two-component system response regulator ResD
MSRTKPRVLVVDDEGDIRVIVGLNLGLAGLEFGEAKDGSEALKILRGGGWDACILDLAMPELDGFGVLDALRAEGIIDDLAVIVLSAKGSPSVAINAMKRGAHAHLTKPFSPAAVAQIVEELIGLSPEERRARRDDMIQRAGTLDRLGLRTV